jgi:hypothetical protein
MLTYSKSLEVALHRVGLIRSNIHACSLEEEGYTWWRAMTEVLVALEE